MSSHKVVSGITHVRCMDALRIVILQATTRTTPVTWPVDPLDAPV